MDSTTWPDPGGYRQHPLSAVFPPMAAAELAELRADIAQHGLRQPIAIFAGQVLDGWHGSCACAETGTEIATVNFEGDEREALAFVLSTNLHRRHLNKSDLALVGARLATHDRAGSTSHRRKPMISAIAISLSAPWPTCSAGGFRPSGFKQSSTSSARVQVQAGFSSSARSFRSGFWNSSSHQTYGSARLSTSKIA